MPDDRGERRERSGREPSVRGLKRRLMHKKQTSDVLSEPGATFIFNALHAATTLPFTTSLCGAQSDSFPWYRVNMSTSKPPERRPRAKTTGALVGTRFQPDLLEAIDLWRKAQFDLPTRPEAVRRLVELGMRNEDSPLGDSVPPALNSARTGT